jgi:16S rRNA (uracil1498-N3)-methyltransferase
MTRTNIPRLHVPSPLSQGVPITIEGAQAHYLLHVMRMKAGEDVRLFNGTDGEWLARVEGVSKKILTLHPYQQTRVQTTTSDVWLLFAPIKAAHGEFLVEKATELGVTRLLPVRTERTVISRINEVRMQAHAVEAAEQSERLDVPIIDALLPLPQVLSAWDASRPLLYGDESGGGASAQELLSGKRPPLALLIGPEGGFSPAEFAYLRSLPFASPLSLGDRILRADTAALAGLTLIGHYSAHHCASNHAVSAAS